MSGMRGMVGCHGVLEVIWGDEGEGGGFCGVVMECLLGSGRCVDFEGGFEHFFV